MPFAASDLTQFMGLGSYVGEVREGPGGQLYEWVQGVDGLGNPLGFWKWAKRLARRALPFAKFIPGYGPAIYAAGELAKRAGLLGIGEVAEGPDGQLYEVVEGIGAFGEPRRSLRRVWLSIPAVIRRRGMRAGARAAVPVRRRVPAAVVPVAPVAPAVPVVPAGARR